MLMATPKNFHTNNLKCRLMMECYYKLRFVNEPTKKKMFLIIVIFDIGSGY